MGFFWNWFQKKPWDISASLDTVNLLNFSSILGFALDLTPPECWLVANELVGCLGLLYLQIVMSSWWRWHPRWGVRVVPKTTYILSLAGSVSMFRGHLHCGLLVSKHVDWVLRHLEGLVLFGRWPSIIDCSWKIPLVFFGELLWMSSWFFRKLFVDFILESVFLRQRHVNLSMFMFCRLGIPWYSPPTIPQSNHNHLPARGKAWEVQRNWWTTGIINTVALIGTYLLQFWIGGDIIYIYTYFGYF